MAASKIMELASVMILGILKFGKAKLKMDEGDCLHKTMPIKNEGEARKYFVQLVRQWKLDVDKAMKDFDGISVLELFRRFQNEANGYGINVGAIANMSQTLFTQWITEKRSKIADIENDKLISRIRTETGIGSVDNDNNVLNALLAIVQEELSMSSKFGQSDGLNDLLNMIQGGE